MKSLKIIVILTGIMFSFAVSASADEIKYTTLAPIKGYVGETEVISERTLSDYLDNMFKLGIALCTGLAVLMLIIGGIQYVSSDAWSKKSDGRERMFAALFGLLIALGSYALLKTINPDLIGTKIALDTLSMDAIKAADYYQKTGEVVNTTPDPSNPGTPGVTPSGTKANIPSDIPVQASGKQVDYSMVAGLQAMNSELAAGGVNWTVTEGYTPSRNHKNPCHAAGTCIDADFYGTADNSDNIKKFVDAANNNGFRAVYETADKSQYDSLVASGVPKYNIQYLPPKNGNAQITGTHFSVYNKK